MITEDNQVIIFHTKQFDIFEKEIKSKSLEKIVEDFPAHLQVLIKNIIGSNNWCCSYEKASLNKNGE